MPKGEHFKKDNPRIYQVSFKVNKTELDNLKEICKEQGISTAVFFRQAIDNFGGEVQSEPIKADNIQVEKPKEAQAAAPVSSDPPVRKKPQSPAEKKGEQMSLF